jgi:hypothetical protein
MGRAKPPKTARVENYNERLANLMVTAFRDYFAC